MRKFLCLPALFVHLVLAAQVREKISINSGWKFLLNDQHEISSGNDGRWKMINLPHTWNDADIIDDTVGYHQGIGWYVKDIFIPASYSEKHLELFFEAACNKATVFVNGSQAGTHTGGFTGFKIYLDDKIRFGVMNNISVKVDNGKYLADSVPPYSGDFNLMGGIYRDVWLIVSNKDRFSQKAGADELYFETSMVNESSAQFIIRGKIQNEIRNASIAFTISEGKKIHHSGKQKIGSYSKAFRIEDKFSSPKIWSPENPHLYELNVQLLNENNELLDELNFNIGFRSFGINEKLEFTLNGKSYKLKGVARHQDFDRIGNALADGIHERDIRLMKDMGSNFLRISHYPHDPAIFNACDKLGVIAWSEIPVVDKYVNNPNFSKNSEIMMEEMVLQNFNHASVGIWGYHNEVRNLEAATLQNARALDSIAKHHDKYRLTAMAFESNTNASWFKSPLMNAMLNVADINGYNVYQGWYRDDYKGIGLFLDSLFSLNKTKPIFLSEYGAGSDINIHSYEPVIFDFSEEYKTTFHEAYVDAGMQRPWMIGFSIWNFIDFQRDGREDVSPNVNNKGMVTVERKPKDVFYFYKSRWSKDPFIYLAGKNWQERIAVTGKNKSVSVPVIVYSNLSSLNLYVEGKAMGAAVSSNGKFEWKVNLHEGNNHIECRSANNSLSDQLNIRYHFIDTTSFNQQFPGNKILINTGQSMAFYIDARSREQWLPDKKYTKGNWGYVGGNIWNSWPNSSWDMVREGIHKPIANTHMEPVFQTFVEELSAWKADVPPGKYRVSLFLAEPFTDKQRNSIARIMNISLNEKTWIQKLDLANDHGILNAMILDKEIIVKNNEGINIRFGAVSGKTILNGVSIEKL